MRYYEKFEFKPNYNSNKIIKKETPYFYDSSDYHFGKFYRVELPRILDGMEYDSILYLNTFLYLNPKLEDKMYWDFFKYSINNIHDFNVKASEFKALIQYRDNITYRDCYKVSRRIIYNERKFAVKFKLNYYSKTFRVDLRKKLKNERIKWWNSGIQELLKNIFLNTMNSTQLSYESLAIESKIKIEKVKDHLNNSRIYIREDELEYTISENKYDEQGKVIGIKPPKKKIIKRQPFKHYIIESQLKYLLSKPNVNFNIRDIVDGCKYYSEYYNEYNQLDKSYVEDWIKDNPYYMERIKYHRKEFSRKKIIIERQNKILLIINYLYKDVPNEAGVKFEYTRNDDGKVVVIHDFGEEFSGDYSMGNYVRSYAHKYDIDEELKNC